MSRAPMDWVTAKEKAGKFIHPAQKQAMGWELDEFQHNPGSLMESIKILEEMKVRNAARLSEGVGFSATTGNSCAAIRDTNLFSTDMDA
ncbi:hypothetical protein DPSP01_010964 [Paraphaeosphaeria sporulosa]